MKYYAVLTPCIFITTLLAYSGESTKLLPMIHKVESTRAPSPIGPYSQAIQVSTPRFVFISGQIPLDTETGVLITDVEAATHKVLSHIQAILQEANMSFTHVVKATIYLTSMGDFVTVNRVYQDYFKDAKVFPARETVQVAALPKGACVEISVIAAE